MDNYDGSEDTSYVMQPTMMSYNEKTISDN